MRKIRVTVFGTGAIGGVLGAFLARYAQADGSDLQVTLIARGEQLAAMRRDGLQVTWSVADLGQGGSGQKQQAGDVMVVRAGDGVVMADSGVDAEMVAAGEQDFILSTL